MFMNHHFFSRDVTWFSGDFATVACQNFQNYNKVSVFEGIKKNI